MNPELHLAQAIEHLRYVAEHAQPDAAALSRTAAMMAERAQDILQGAGAAPALAELPREELAALVRERRAQAGLSLRQLARATGLAVGTIRSVERGARDPSRDTVLRLVGVPALGLLDSGETASGKAREPRPNAWLLPQYDRRALLDEMSEILNGLGGHLEQTCLYLDDESALDWLKLVSSDSMIERLKTIPMDEVARAAVGSDRTPLTLIALGVGDGRSEIELAQQILTEAPGIDLRLNLLDISHTLLTIAHQRATDTLPSTVRVESLHGDFNRLSRYPVLVKQGAEGRRRIWVMVGGTLTNLDNEVRFLRDQLSLAAKGDVLVLDYALGYAPGDDLEAVRAKDPIFRGMGDVWAKWFSGPVRRYCRDAKTYTLGMDVIEATVRGSYELDFFVDVTTVTGDERRYHACRSRRYQREELLRLLSRYGWSVRGTWTYGTGGKYEIAVAWKT